MKKLAISFVIAYFVLLIIAVIFQRSLLFIPHDDVVMPEQRGLVGFEQNWVSAGEGEPKVKIWHNDYKGKEDIVIYFHGNSGRLSNNARVFKALDAQGYGVFAMTYRGYGGSEGSPSESGILKDSQALIDMISETEDSKNITVIGRSLGTGVATYLASENELDKVVLISPYTSITDIAADIYWMFPTRWLLWDRFDSFDRIKKVSEPVLIIHGDIDNVVPLKFGQKLFENANEPKKMIILQGKGHERLGFAEMINSGALASNF